MVDAMGSGILLGFDSFVVCLGLGTLIPRRWCASLALAFGVCDAAASAAGALVGNWMPNALGRDWSPLLAFGIVAYAASVVVFATRPPRLGWRARAWFVVPLILSLDNLLAGARAPGSALFVNSLCAAAASTVLALVGLKLGAFVRERRWSAQAARSAS
jgi:putative Mn2+ efflux pump MntP